MERRFDHHDRCRVAAVAAVLLPILTVSAAPAQSLLLSLETGAVPAAGGAPVADEEILLLPSPLQGGAVRFLPSRAWEPLTGDGNGNGRYDDAPSDVADMALVPGAASPFTIFDLAFSLTANRTFAAGGTALDGDVIRLVPGGGFVALWTETQLAAATGTSGIDVDAVHIAPQGDLIFSFAEDETTSSASLIAANGGSSVLDETTVFVLPPGALSASILYTKDQIVAMANQAFQGSAATVVDVTAVAEDPLDPAAHILALGSTAQAFAGRVLSTRNGGTPATLHGVALDAAGFGFAAPAVLDGLALVPDRAPPTLLDAPADTLSIQAGMTGVIRVIQGTPGNPVRLVAAPATLPAPQVSSLSFPMGFGAVLMDIGHHAVEMSLQAAPFLLLLGPTGEAEYAFGTSGLPAGAAVMVQGFDLVTLELLSPLVIETIP